MAVSDSSPPKYNLSDTQNTNLILNEQTSISHDELKSNINNYIDDKDFNLCMNVSDDPIYMIIHPDEKSTLKIEHHSQFLSFKDEETIKRELRRKRNCESSRRRQAKLNNLLHELTNKVNELEFKNNNLVQIINQRQSYKYLLEKKYHEEIFIIKHKKIKKTLCSKSLSW